MHKVALWSHPAPNKTMRTAACGEMLGLKTVCLCLALGIDETRWHSANSLDLLSTMVRSAKVQGILIA